jgi:hypothetical protein
VELAAVEVVGDLDQRLAARTRRAALAEEREPLAGLEQRQREIRDRAAALVGSYEISGLVHYRQLLDQALEALARPPMDDMGKLYGPASADSAASARRFSAWYFCQGSTPWASPYRKAPISSIAPHR